MTRYIFEHVIQEVIKAGVTEFCLCPGSRNSPFINVLMQCPTLKKHFWYEERSAAFFALGRTRSTHAPVAVITTSGSAAGELLPATMEAHYTGTPLLLITADRPRRFRGTGAPQSAEQEGLFGVYAHFEQDLEGKEICKIHEWDRSGPAHINVCIEEPKSYPSTIFELPEVNSNDHSENRVSTVNSDPLFDFFQQSTSPLVIVSALAPEDQSAVADFLLAMNAPIYCEGGSGLREDPRLAHLRIRMESAIWDLSKSNEYVIDGILRMGGVPVTRIWRDLESLSGSLAQCSLSAVPFSGLSWGKHIQCNLTKFLSSFTIPAEWKAQDFSQWWKEDQELVQRLDELLTQYPASEPALFRELSKKIAPNAMVYLGNSLPVREWDLASTYVSNRITIETSRGVNGIDGQLSTFLGLCEEGRENWAILGDLTMLYDFPALWILNTMPQIPINVVVMNNGGGKIFSRLYRDPVFQNLHGFDFEHFAKSWKIPYTFLHGTVETDPLPLQSFIEICPDPSETVNFWKAYDELTQKQLV